MGEQRGAYRVLVGKIEFERSLKDLDKNRRKIIIFLPHKQHPV